MGLDGRFAGLTELIARYWGFRALRPLQEPAIRAVLEGRDSLVVMPTGAGKSLCFQAPALLTPERPTVVISPLIALMKDQVDRLRSIGINARHIDHTLSPDEKREIFDELKARRVPLLFVAPERLMLSSFQSFLQQLDVQTFVIDEAHCISHWGHDFRPEYRQISSLRTLFPAAHFHGYTATATESVRKDIVTQLQLRDPLVLVGDFDRPNLTYRILPRGKVLDQVVEVLGRHPKEAGIIYCFRKRDVDDLTLQLQQRGFSALPYHADIPGEVRRQTHEAFRKEECNLIVATVAFGMGIDRSNIRFVIHAAAPASIEHYQQETGRAGRDGLEAECVLLFSISDVIFRKKMAIRDVEEGTMPPERLPIIHAHLEAMGKFCRTGLCRHRFLVEHFAQTYSSMNCMACDICLSEVDFEPDSLIIAQKILSCVSRVQERFGVGQIVDILVGAETERIRSLGHDKLTTYGLLKDHKTPQIRDWVHQLLNQDALEQTEDDRPVLKLNDASWAIMRKQKEIRLLRSVVRAKAKASQAEVASWEGVDPELADHLRVWRKELATAKKLPPYGIFDDRTLRELCRVRPSNIDKLKVIYGIGEKRLSEFGKELLKQIRDYCSENGLELDQAGRVETTVAPVNVTAGAEATFYLFRRGASIEEAAEERGISPKTARDYLCSYLESEKPKSIDSWVSRDMQQQVRVAAEKMGLARLKPIFVELKEAISYDVIAIVVSHLRGSEGR